ncbi:anti-sigma factor [Prosthecomicrobium sp. N25]|uniref:anti-sigma factor n=1 Tax=Prosthecomicrobium sp. N25 TaxID=3129254 RepID=UPI003077278E
MTAPPPPPAPAAPGPDRDLLAAEWVLGLAEGADRAEAERLVAADPAFRAAVAGWRRRLAELDSATPPADVPAGLWPSLLARLDGPSPAADPVEADRDAPSGAVLLPFPPTGRPGAGPVAGLWGSVRVWRGLAAAAVVAMGLVIGTYWEMPAPRPQVVAVLLVEPGKPGAVVEAFADGRVRLVPLADLPVPAGRALQVWTLRDRAEGPISVGLMPRARTLPLDLGHLPDPAPDQLFEITLEPETGSPTGRPTGPVLMKGLAARTL